MREHLIPTAVLSALLLGAGVSRAAGVSLPPQSVVEMMKVPEHAPAYVNGAARVKGIFVARGPSLASGDDWLFQVFTSAREAREFSAKGYVESRAEKPEPDPCLFVSGDPSEFGEAWPAIATPVIRPSSSISTKVLGIHLETLHGDGTADHPASLDVIDAWFDIRSRGLKLVSRSTLALATVAEGPLSARVLAARGADAVHLVVVPPSTPEGRGGMFARAVIQNRGEVGMSECRHTRVTLEAHAGAGENADNTFQQAVPIPPEPGDPKAKDGVTDFNSPMQLQTLRVHLSASRNTDASEPIVSVSFHADPLKPFG